jgi:protein-disulfide isomerase
MKPRTLVTITLAAAALVIAAVVIVARSNTTTTAAGATIDVSAQPILGNAEATVTMVVFEDFRCPACQNFELTVMPEIRRDYVDRGRVRVAYMNLPVVNPVSAGEHVARVGECVFAQSNEAFWEMKTPLYRAQGELSDARRVVELANQYAPGIDAGVLDACLADPASLQAVRDDVKVAVELQVRATPTVFVNGRMVTPATLANVRAEIDRALRN